MKPTPIDPMLVKSDGWEVIEVTPEYRRSVLQIDENAFIYKTEYLLDERLVEQNRESFNNSYGKRFGDGKIVASVPMNKWMREIAPRLQQGDRDFSAWWLDRSENAPFRTFRGKVQKR